MARCGVALVGQSKPKWGDLKAVVGCGRRGDTVTRRRGGLDRADFGTGEGTVIAHQFASFVRLSKHRGGDALTASGGEGGAEDRMGFGALRHYIVGARDRWLGGRVLGRLYGLWLGPGLALLL